VKLCEKPDTPEIPEIPVYMNKYYLNYNNIKINKIKLITVIQIRYEKRV
jgi:hypothetical protein